jgi:mono/diheme cytochrome c family protein
MKKLTIVLALASAAMLAACEPTPVAQSSNDATRAARVVRGKELVAFGGCNHCHTPMKMTDKGPELDMSRMLSGHPQEIKLTRPQKLDGPWGWMATHSNTAFAGGWGVSYAFNLTPDQNTGLGIWTEEMFIQTMRTGKHMGVSRPILPPMPWENLNSLSDEDLKSLYAYLRSIPAIPNLVPTALEPHEVDEKLLSSAHERKTSRAVSQ